MEIPGAPLPNRGVAPGLYRVTWRSGGSSLAAIGVKADGSRWIAPTNWDRPGTLSDDQWDAVDRCEPETLRKERDEARKELDDVARAAAQSRAERDDIFVKLKSTRDALGAGAVEHVVDAAKRVMAELDEVRQKAARDHEADRRMRDALKAEVERLRATPTGDLADAASALAETRAQLERANGDLARLRADALSVGGGAVRKAYDVCHAALDDVKAPKTGSCAERIDEARRERHAVVRRARQRRRRRGRW